VAPAAGQTFLYDLRSSTAHLWVIVTEPDPDERFLIVSLTSLKGSKDQTVILHVGEHPFLKWATCVAYAQSDLINTDRFKEILASGNAKMHANLSPQRTALILDGFLASDFTKKRIVEFVKRYKRLKSVV
jgi:hypothetical protein